MNATLRNLLQENAEGWGQVCARADFLGLLLRLRRREGQRLEQKTRLPLVNVTLGNSNERSCRDPLRRESPLR